MVGSAGGIRGDCLALLLLDLLLLALFVFGDRGGNNGLFGGCKDDLVEDSAEDLWWSVEDEYFLADDMSIISAPQEKNNSLSEN